ncbi:unnamed protein product [Rhodiola kirilowii]
MIESSSIDGEAMEACTRRDAPLEKTAPVSSLNGIDGVPSDSSNCADDELTTDDIAAQPDFSMLKGRICLDSLSVRELQQTFRATFGRPTAVKDKLWLKRRIAMALSNSCQIPTMTFQIEDDKVVRIGGLDADAGVHDVSGNTRSESSDHQQTKQVCEIHISAERAVNPSSDCEFPSDGLQLDHNAAKRVRKPTKRYIEESSEVEPQQPGRRLSPSIKTTAQSQMLYTSRHSSISNIYHNSETAVTLLDTIGESGIQVPFASRVRRSRPREDITSLLLIGPQDDRRSPLADEIKLPQKIEQKKESMEGNPSTSDDGPVSVPPVMGDMRRKHHRAWTLSEVMKLVEGVSRYGAGKWSEIKRLSFTSYPHRSSVDLKDKWRNLLRASFTESSHDSKGVSLRKPTQSPLPAPILSKIRELSERQGQIPPINNSTKMMGSCERGPGSGFL